MWNMRKNPRKPRPAIPIAHLFILALAAGSIRGAAVGDTVGHRVESRSLAARVEAYVTTIKAYVTTIKAYVTTIKAYVTTIKAYVTTIKAYVTIIEAL